MFGKEYAQRPAILLQSFGQINEKYLKKTKTKKSIFFERLQKLYIFLFGIPEIGFQIRSIYFKKILSTNLSHKHFKKILDAGCGIGVYTILLGKIFTDAKVTGGDINKDKLISCLLLASQLYIKNVSFSYFDVTKISKKEVLTYDLIVSIDVLEHIDNYMEALKNFYRLLQNGGYLYIHVPQPDQKRIFRSFTTWHHKDHAHEGIAKNELEKQLKKLGFNIIISRETFGFFGKLAWEINHLILSRSFVLAGITFPFLYILARLDQLWRNTDGLGVAILVQKNNYAK